MAFFTVHGMRGELSCNSVPKLNSVLSGRAARPGAVSRRLLLPAPWLLYPLPGVQPRVGPLTVPGQKLTGEARPWLAPAALTPLAGWRLLGSQGLRQGGGRNVNSRKWQVVWLERGQTLGVLHLLTTSIASSSSRVSGRSFISLFRTELFGLLSTRGRPCPRALVANVAGYFR